MAGAGGEVDDLKEDTDYRKNGPFAQKKKKKKRKEKRKRLFVYFYFIFGLFFS